MNKIEEILCSTFDVEFENFYDEYGIASALEYEYHRTYDPHKIIEVMKIYAEYYTKLHCENLFRIMTQYSKYTPEELSKIVLETNLPDHE